MKKRVGILFLSLSLAWAGVTAAGMEETYKIAPGDAIEISVWKDEELTKQIVVPPDGIVAFPLVGDIDVFPLTVTEVRKIVAERLAEYLPGATVTVMLLTANSLAAYVIGKVNNPGRFPISHDTNVLQILSMAGGLNPYASHDKIILVRQEGGKNIKIPFNYKEVKKGENLEQNIFLKRGDVVVVP